MPQDERSWFPWVPPQLCDTFRVLIVVASMTYPLYEVVSSLTRSPDLVLDPCTDLPCNYVRVFEGASIPGTGTRVIRVQNGVERPVFLEPKWVQWNMWNLLPFVNFTVVESVDFSDQKHGTHLPAYSLESSNLNDFLDERANHSGKIMREAMQNATNDLPDFITPATTAALTVCYYLQILLSRPIGWLVDFVIPDFIIESRGDFPVQRIPSAYVGSSNSTAKQVCADPAVMKHLENFMALGPSKVVYTWGLCCWAFFTFLHDLLLLCYKPEPLEEDVDQKDAHIANEKWTLLVGALSVCCLTIATGACFQWSTGALSIFAAPVDIGNEDIVCFYRLPYIQAFFALGTPILLLSMLMSRIRSMALAMVHGDFLYTDKYRVPFKYVARSKSWHADDALIHDIGGCHLVTHPEKQQEPPHWRWRRRALLCLDCVVLIVQVSVIALAGFNITMKGGEFAFATLSLPEDEVGPKLRYLIIFLVHLPSIIFILIGLLQIGVLLRRIYRCCTSTIKELIYGNLLRPVIMIICWSAGFCLWPGEMIWHPEKIVNLFQAELWGNSGILLFLMGISFIRTNFYDISDSLTDLKNFAARCRYCKGELTQVDEPKKMCAWCRTEGVKLACPKVGCDYGLCHEHCEACKLSKIPVPQQLKGCIKRDVIKIPSWSTWYHEFFRIEAINDVASGTKATDDEDKGTEDPRDVSAQVAAGEGSPTWEASREESQHLLGSSSGLPADSAGPASSSRGCC